jgi:acetyl-CoA/propionyl-CoA carboxylase biotin carboxyl carrier protein
VDTGVADGSVVGSDYDPMLAKIIVHAEDRATALRRMDGALADYHLLGVRTNVGFLRSLLGHPDVVAGELDTGLVERALEDLDPGAEEESDAAALVAAALVPLLDAEPDGLGPRSPFDLPGGWRVGVPAPVVLQLTPPDAEPVEVRVTGRAASATVVVGDAAPVSASASRDVGVLRITVDGIGHRFVHAVADGVVWLGLGGRTWAIRESERLDRLGTAEDASGGPLLAPMPGTVTVVHVAQGDAVTAGQALMVVEAMKMEHPITAPVDGFVSALHVRAGEQVGMEQALAVIDAAETAAAPETEGDT